MANQFKFKRSPAVHAGAMMIAAVLVAGFIGLLESERATFTADVAEVVASPSLPEALVADVDNATVKPGEAAAARKRG